jgi:MFS transporter, CP family, cyanate transporter
MPFTFIVSLLAGRLANQKSLVIFTVVLFLGGIAGLLSGGPKILTLSIILLGLSNGAGLGLALSFFGLRSSNSQEAAELSGMAQSVGYLLSAVAPATFGFLHDLTHSWNLPLLILMALSLVQLIVGFGAGRNVLVTPIEEQRIVV